ncbi:MAG: DUF4388 domain-containing protein [Deltaproteobacteria bacterium]|nr:DUF4388 domain-containing protein [Deltaproteobacteria bacterium]
MAKIKKIGEILIELGFITEEQLRAALNHQKTNDHGKKIGEILVELGFVHELDLLKCLSGLFKIRYTSSEKLSHLSIPQWMLDIIPADFAEKHHVLPFFCYDKSKILSVVVSDPQDQELLKLIRKVSGYHEVERYLALESAIKASIAKHYKTGGTATKKGEPGPTTGQPHAVASFVPKGQENLDDRYIASPEVPLDERTLLKKRPQEIPPDRIERLMGSGGGKERLADRVSAGSLMSDDTFIEVLNIVVNVLEMYRGGDFKGHSAQVAKMAKEMSVDLGLRPHETYCNVVAAYLHDCCMNAPAHLTLLQYNAEKTGELLQKYSKAAARLFEKARLPEEVYATLAHTFERFDGKGYPDGVKGTEIPLGARMIAVVDAFVHLVSFEKRGADNPYKSSFAEIKLLGKKYFDPALIDVLENVAIDYFVDERSARVVVVDSDPGELGRLSRILKRSGILTYLSKDTDEAAHFLENAPVNLVISETTIHPMDGFSFCSSVKAKHPDVYFLFLSEHHDAVTVGSGFDAGADDFITKPYNPDILIAKIQNAIKLATRKEEESAERALHKKGLTGNLTEIKVIDLIQMLSGSRKTGALKLFKEEESGILYFEDGQIVSARYNDDDGVKAFNRLVRWEHGLFILDPDAELPAQEIFEKTEGLLMEALRIWDEDESQ